MTDFATLGPSVQKAIEAVKQLPTVPEGPECPLCHDTRYLWDFPGVNPRLCGCVLKTRQEAYKRRYKESVVAGGEAIRLASIDKAQGQIPYVLDRFKAAMDVNKTCNSLLLSGVHGRGKTYAGHYMASVMMAKKKCSGWYVNSRYFADKVAAMYKNETAAEWVDGITYRMQTSPVFFLDDFGQEPEGKAAQQRLITAINLRFQAWLPTVITTNLTLDEITGRYGAGEGSRWLSGQRWCAWINCEGKDLRSQL